MDYVLTPLLEEIRVDSLATVHYFEYRSDFSFWGEAHDFWELLYVDKGEICVTAGEREFVLRQGEMHFHRPLEFHNLHANGIVAPNLVVVAFASASAAMSHFERRTVRAGGEARQLIARLVSEARAAYSSSLDDPGLKRLELRDQIPFGAQQAIKCCLEMLLITLVRQGAHPPAAAARSLVREKAQEEDAARITRYLEGNLHRKLTLDDVCRENLIGRSCLQKLFCGMSGGGVMEYFCRMKVERAKQMIREGSDNFSQIARRLGFSSLQYFSRRFKKETGMTPTQYAVSVKGRCEAAAKIPPAGRPDGA